MPRPTNHRIGANLAVDFDDPSIPAADANARIVGLARKMIAANEKLIALDPEQASHKWDLAEGRLRLGAGLLEQKAFREAIEQFQLASPCWQPERPTKQMRMQDSGAS